MNMTIVITSAEPDSEINAVLEYSVHVIVDLTIDEISTKGRADHRRSLQFEAGVDAGLVANQ